MTDNVWGDRRDARSCISTVVHLLSMVLRAPSRTVGGSLSASETSYFPIKYRRTTKRRKSVNKKPA